MSTTPAPILGANFLIKAASGTATLVVGQTSGTISISRDMIDVTTKSSSSTLDKGILPGIGNWEVSVSGAYYVTSGGVIKDATGPMIQTGAPVSVTCEIGGDTFTGSGYISSLSVTGDQTDKVTYDLTITGNGGYTLTAAS